MDIVNRVKGILFTPETEWPAIEKEPGAPGYLFPNYVVYLAAIPPLAGFIGSSVLGVTAPATGTMRVGLFAGLLAAVIGYALSFIVVYALAVLIDRLAPRFGGTKDFPSALKVTVYSLTPYWVASVLQVFAGLSFIGSVVGLFGVYLVWSGLPRLMRVSADRAVGYVATVVVCAIAMILMLTAIVAYVRSAA